MTKAFKAIQSHFKTAFPTLRVLLNWPDPTKRIKFPYLVVIQVTQNFEHAYPKVLEKYQQQNRTIVVNRLGEIRGQLDLHYFGQNLEGLQTFLDGFLPKLKAPPDEEARILEISYGPKKYKTIVLRPVSYNFDQTSYPLQTGSGRRVIISCQYSLTDWVAETQNILETIRLEGTVSEREMA